MNSVINFFTDPENIILLLTMVIPLVYTTIINTQKDKIEEEKPLIIGLSVPFILAFSITLLLIFFNKGIDVSYRYKLIYSFLIISLLFFLLSFGITGTQSPETIGLYNVQIIIYVFIMYVISRLELKP